MQSAIRERTKAQTIRSFDQDMKDLARVTADKNWHMVAIITREMATKADKIYKGW